MKRIHSAFTKLSALALLLAPFMSVSGNIAIHASPVAASELAPQAPAADVLLIDDDLSNGNRSAECHDYRGTYTQALDTLGLTYQVFETTSTTPDPGTSPRPHFVNFEGAGAYRLVIYFSGDEHCGQELGWNVPQMQAYLNGGGRMIIFSQDALYFDNQFANAALSVPTTFSPTLYFGASYITDTIAVASVQGSSAFSYTSGLAHTIGVTETSIDQAGLAVVSGADPAIILRNGVDPTQIVGTRISSDPSIESAKGLFIRQNLAYRTELVTYGLEGIPSTSDRAKLLDALVGFVRDQFSVSFRRHVLHTNIGKPTILSAMASSNITQTVTGFTNSIVKYRWDFGDGSPVVTTTTPSVNHTFALKGLYSIIVEATDGFGNRAIDRALVNNLYRLYFILVMR